MTRTATVALPSYGVYAQVTAPHGGRDVKFTGKQACFVRTNTRTNLTDEQKHWMKTKLIAWEHVPFHPPSKEVCEDIVVKGVRDHKRTNVNPPFLGTIRSRRNWTMEPATGQRSSASGASTAAIWCCQFLIHAARCKHRGLVHLRKEPEVTSCVLQCCSSQELISTCSLFVASFCAIVCGRVPPFSMCIVVL